MPSALSNPTVGGRACEASGVRVRAFRGAARLFGVLVVVAASGSGLGCLASRYYPEGTDRAYLLHGPAGPLIVLNGDLEYSVIRLKRDFACTKENLSLATAPLPPEENEPPAWTVVEPRDGFVSLARKIRVRLYAVQDGFVDHKDQTLIVVGGKPFRDPVISSQNLVHFYNQLLACRDQLEGGA